jgi:preprotein translocase subunit SecG
VDGIAFGLEVAFAREKRYWTSPAMLTAFLTVLHVTAAMFLILVVLLQQGKGGGLGALGGGATQVFGGGGAGNFMTRLTAVCAGIFMMTSMSLAYLSSGGDRAMRKALAEEASADAATTSAPPAAKPIEAPLAPVAPTPTSAPSTP